MDNTPRLKAHGLLTFNTLMRVIDEGAIKWWNEQQTDPAKRIEMHPFRAEYIKDLTGTAEKRQTNRIITFRKIRLAPGHMGPSPFSGTAEHRPRVRETIMENGRPVVIKGKWIDALARFDCFAPTWSEATQLEEDFEDLMDMFTGAIMNSGVNKMIFQGSYSESFQMDTDYYYQPVTYYFRLEKQYRENKSLVKEFEVLVNNVYQRIISESDSQIL